MYVMLIYKILGIFLSAYSDIMILSQTKSKNSTDGLCQLSETEQLQKLIKENLELKAEKFARDVELEFGCHGQLDRIMPVPNFNYGLHQLESHIDSLRRYDALIEKRAGIKIDASREAVTVLFLIMNQYRVQEKMCGEIAARRNLRELVSRIMLYVDMRPDHRNYRPADCFSKGGWQDYFFMFVLPATDRVGAETFLERVYKNSVLSFPDEVLISYGLANHAADVEARLDKESSRKIAVALVELAKERATKQIPPFSGKLEKPAQY